MRCWILGVFAYFATVITKRSKTEEAFKNEQSSNIGGHERQDEDKQKHNTNNYKDQHYGSRPKKTEANPGVRKGSTVPPSYRDNHRVTHIYRQVR